MQEPLHVWRFSDGKRGHENQTRGLVEALRRMVPVEDCEVPVAKTSANPLDYFLKRFRPGESLPTPDLLIGAGRQTHRALLAAKRSTGAPAVVLMSPPRWLQNRFDLCFIPEHDRVTASNAVATHGALTSITPGGEHSPDRGVILIGGPSAHHHWDGHAIVANVREIVTRPVPSIQWQLTTSRRTPPETVTDLQSLDTPNLQVWPVETTDPNWVPTKLAESGFAWVTEDSVSMVYEAVTSGAATGILPVPRKREKSRVVRGLDQLAQAGHVSRFDPSSPLPEPPSRDRVFDEASRCAKIIMTRFFT